MASFVQRLVVVHVVVFDGVLGPHDVICQIALAAAVEVPVTHDMVLSMGWDKRWDGVGCRW